MVFWIPTLGFFFSPAQLTQANFNTGTLKLFSIETPNYWFFSHISTLKISYKKGWLAIIIFYVYRLNIQYICVLHT